MLTTDFSRGDTRTSDQLKSGDPRNIVGPIPRTQIFHPPEAAGPHQP